MSDEALGVRLVDEGLLKPEQLVEVLRWSVAQRERQAYAVAALGYVDQRELVRSQSRHYRVAAVDLAQVAVEEAVLRMVSPGLAKSGPALPLRLRDGTLVVAVADPSNRSLLDMLRTSTHVEAVELLLAEELILREAIRRAYDPARVPASDGVWHVSESQRPPAARTCPACGFEGSHKFCASCGASLVEDESEGSGSMDATAVRPGQEGSGGMGPTVSPPAARPTPEAESEPSTWEIGGRVLSGEFEVKRFLGKGGFGSVYLVEMRPQARKPGAYVVTGSLYAAKRVPVGWLSDRVAILHEIQAWAELPEHPHIVPYRFFRTEPDAIVLLSEYQPRGSVQNLGAKGPVERIDVILDVGIQSLVGLSVLHAQALVHRDVKPGNMLLSEDGRVVISDFGLVSEVPQWSAHGSDGALTPLFASPEQLRKETLTPRSDLYSWAVSVLMLAEGRRLWAGSVSTESALERYFADALPDGPAVLPPPLLEVLHACTRPRADERPSDAYALAEGLTRLYERVTGARYPREIGPRPVRVGRERSGAREESWFQARRAAEAVFGDLLDLNDRIEVSDPELRDSFWELVDLRPGNMTSDAADNGLAPMAQFINAIAMLERAHEAGMGLFRMDIDLGIDIDQELPSFRESVKDVCRELTWRYEHLGDLGGAAIARHSYENLLRADERLGDVMPTTIRLHQLEDLRGIAISASEQGNDQEAMDRFQECMEGAYAAREHAAPSEIAGLDTLIFQVMADIGVIHQKRGAWENALQTYDIALSNAQNAGLLESMDGATLGWVVGQRAIAFDHLGRVEDSLADFDWALDLFEGSRTAGGDVHMSTALNKAVTLSRIGRPDEALPLLERVIRARRGFVDAGFDWRDRHRLAYALSLYGSDLRETGSRRAAVSAFDEAHAIWKRLVEIEGHVELGEYQVRAMMNGGELWEEGDN